MGLSLAIIIIVIYTSALLLILVVKRIEYRLTMLADAGPAEGWVPARVAHSGGGG